MHTEIRVGTRASELALTQTRHFCQELRKRHPNVRLAEVRIASEGDHTTTPLSEAHTPGVFVSALRDALLNGHVDVIVHSLKDLPVDAHPKILTACIPSRADTRDALISRDRLTLNELPRNARVGTSSPRRAAWLRQQRNDLEIVNIRGNIDSRIRQVHNGHYDATVLAMAGLNRTGRTTEANEIYDTETCVPAAGQGALSVECRATDTTLFRMLRGLNDDLTELLTTAERAVLAELRAGCASAIAATAQLTRDQLCVTAEISDELTGDTARTRVTVTAELGDKAAASNAGIVAAQQLRRSAVFSAVRHTLQTPATPKLGRAVLLVRANRNAADAHALGEFGISTLSEAHLTIAAHPNTAGAQSLVSAVRSNQLSWVIATSAHALQHWEHLLAPGELHDTLQHATHIRFAAVGDHTRRALQKLGAADVLTPRCASYAALVEHLVTTEPLPIIIPSGSRTYTDPDSRLTKHGFTLMRECLYRTEFATTAPTTESALQQGTLGAVLFRSPSAVHAYIALHGHTDLPVFCAGSFTAHSASEVGLNVAGCAVDPDPQVLARMIATHMNGQA